MRRLADSVIAGVTVVALCSGAWLLRSGTASHAPPQPSAAQAHIRSSTSSASGTGNTPGASSRAGSSGASGADEPVAVPLPPSPPDRIRIPSIRVDAPLMGLGLTPTGSLDVPPAEKENLAGWYEAGSTPGARGTSIVAGHVDNADGPAVFFGLGALKRGATVEVDRRDGGIAVFTVDAVEVYDARDFPDQKVYGASTRAELRVITCGGGYSRATGYQGNVVVFAHLTGSRAG
ncbi:class F sortase [Streptomyces europaeiscabiei]|uniref:Class F sortase n=1 Tax=Streptomyces europaeiscabiei TaxID=146819 RepID=A0AAJ2PNR3_9ACTN|nr:MULTISPECIES: class F sortase [Streptomyces]KFF98086.1 peptidase C60 [Streptomyces scabiei]MDX3130720.1 class F sortase [Streptomyces europaeiscabiei]